MATKPDPRDKPVDSGPPGPAIGPPASWREQPVDSGPPGPAIGPPGTRPPPQDTKEKPLPGADVTDPYQELVKWAVGQFPGWAAYDEVQMRAALGRMIDISTPRNIMKAAQNLTGWDGSALGALSPADYAVWAGNLTSPLMQGWAAAGWTPEQVRAWVEGIGSSWQESAGGGAGNRAILQVAQQRGFGLIRPPEIPFDPVTLRDYLAAHPDLDPAVVNLLQTILKGEGIQSPDANIGQALAAMGITRAGGGSAMRELFAGDGVAYLRFVLQEGGDVVQALGAIFQNGSPGLRNSPLGQIPGKDYNSANELWPMIVEYERAKANPNNPHGYDVLSPWQAYQAGQLTWGDYRMIEHAKSLGSGAFAAQGNYVPPNNDWSYFDGESFNAYVTREFGENWEDQVGDDDPSVGWGEGKQGPPDGWKHRTNGGQNVWAYQALVGGMNLNVFIPPGYEFETGRFMTPLMSQQLSGGLGSGRDRGHGEGED